MGRVNLEDLSKEELQDLMGKYNDYVMNYGEEHELGGCPVSIYEYYDNEYQLEKEIPMLKGVGVKDTENGIKIVLMSMSDEILNQYNVEVNMGGYNDNDLFKVCYNISQKINDLYYENNGELTQEQVVNVVRDELVK